MKDTDEENYSWDVAWFSGMSYGAAISSNPEEASAGAVVTPATATGWMKVYHYDATMDPTTGYPMICPREHLSDKFLNGIRVCGLENNKWIPIKKAVPAGRTYAGFQIMDRGNMYIFYWK